MIGVIQMIFVTVGTSDFDFIRLVKFMDESAKNIREEIIIQKGKTNYKTKNCKGFDFIEDKKYHKYMQNARIIITHAGVGSILTCLKYNKKPVIVPRLKKYGEHIDNHQIEIAKKFSEKFYLEVIENVNKLKSIIKVRKNRRFKRFKDYKLIKFLKNELKK